MSSATMGNGNPLPESAESDLLSHLRRDNVPWPDEQTLIRTAVCAAEVADLPAPHRGFVAFDLDDTVIEVHKTVVPDAALKRSTDFSAMRRSLLKTLIHRRSSNPADRFDLQRYPHLMNPLICVRPRTGMFELLTSLRRMGVGLVLVTASARMRVEFLADRMPILRQLFSVNGQPLIVAAEAMMQTQQHKLCEGSKCEHSRRAHELRPLSLAAKTPALVAVAAGISEYDYLVDDSETVASLFVNSGLADRLIRVDSQANSASIVDSIRMKLSQFYALEVSQGSVHEWPLIEDPWFYPLEHVTDQLPAERENG